MNEVISAFKNKIKQNKKHPFLLQEKSRKKWFYKNNLSEKSLRFFYL